MVDKEPDDMVIRAIGVLARCCAGPFATEIDVGCDIARELAFNARIQHEGLRLALKAAPDPRELAQARERIAELEQAKGVTWHVHHDRAQRAEAMLAKVREELALWSFGSGGVLDPHNDAIECVHRIRALLDNGKERG